MAVGPIDAEAVKARAAAWETGRRSGPDGISIIRKGGGQSDWLCDLWLAEA